MGETLKSAMRGKRGAGAMRWLDRLLVVLAVTQLALAYAFALLVHDYARATWHLGTAAVTYWLSRHK